MKIIKTIYWKIKNRLEVVYQDMLFNVNGSRGGGGLLSHKKDDRDKIFGGWFRRTPAYPSLTLAPKKWVFDQLYFNICVFASAVMADSYQEGKRFSIQFAVKCAKREGMITGNGYSYLRAALSISKKYGRLPYEMMPDEIDGQSWYEYSKWDVTDEMLAEAAKYKSPSYSKINTVGDAIKALESGLVLHTANRWYSAMNNPQEPNYWLKKLGKYIGGHAWLASGYKADNEIIDRWEVLQSFGTSYGDDGYCNIKDLFDKNNFPVYVSEKIKGRTDVDRFLGLYEGLCVKGDENSIYLIENGKRRGIKNWETFEKMNQFPTFYNAENELLLKLPKGELLT